MEGHAVGLKAQLVCIDQDIDSHLRHAAELARQRPFGAFAIRQDAAEHFGTRSRAGNLFDFLVAVDGIQANAEREGAGNVALLLDRIAEGDAVCRCTGIQSHLDLGNRSAVEVRSHRSEKLQDGRLGIGLNGIVDGAVGERVTESLEIVAHDVEVHNEARAVRTSGLDEVENTGSGHGQSLRNLKAPAKPEDKGRTRMRQARLVETPVP